MAALRGCKKQSAELFQQQTRKMGGWMAQIRHESEVVGS